MPEDLLRKNITIAAQIASFEIKFLDILARIARPSMGFEVDESVLLVSRDRTRGCREFSKSHGSKSLGYGIVECSFAWI